MKLRFYHNGDNSTGIQGESIFVELDAESSDNPRQYAEFFAKCILPGLAVLWDYEAKWEIVEAPQKTKGIHPISPTSNYENFESNPENRIEG